MLDLSLEQARAFSSEVETGSRRENASNQESRAPFRCDRNGNGSGAAGRRRPSPAALEPGAEALVGRALRRFAGRARWADAAAPFLLGAGLAKPFVLVRRQ